MRRERDYVIECDDIVIEEHLGKDFATCSSISESLESANRQVMPTPTLVSQYDNRSFRPTRTTAKLPLWKIPLRVY